MNIPQSKLLRLRFLARIVRKEIRYLGLTDQRLFQVPFTRQKLEQLDKEIELAERLDAFVTRFGRLQDIRTAFPCRSMRAIKSWTLSTKLSTRVRFIGPGSARSIAAG